MNSAPHLLPEDRPEFERAVDEALRDARRRPGLAAAGEQISAEQLRVMALSAATAIAADAAEEYERYVALRTRLRDNGVDKRTATASGTGASGSGAAGSGSGTAGSASRSGDGDRTDEGEKSGGTGGLSLAGVGEGVGEATGAGLLAMVSVLVPLLAGTAAVIFLLLGNVLRVVSPEPSIAAPMRGAGWVFAVLAAAGIVVAMAELWLTAVRNGAGSRRGSSGEGAGEDADGAARREEGESRLAREVSAARTVWREALLERGIVPFLERVLAARAGDVERAAGSAPAPAAESRGTEPSQTPRTPSQGEERTPRLGYSGPDFSSRSPAEDKDRGEHESLRPRYSSPDYSSPDYGGPEHKPE